jgi:predicted AAA+ superfamily ATPase
MRAWYEVIKPREDILSGELNEAIFAANLADVLHERAPLEYHDPAHFFQQTYPTQGLVNLLATVAKRLAEGVGDSVIQLQTPFGGGKTHALISLYHLFRHGMQYRDAALVCQSLERAGLDALPEVRIACFVGEDADPLKGKTPWGALAEQLGVYPLVQEHDLRRRAPGRDLVLQMLGERPTLILLDELVPYLVGAKDLQDQVAGVLSAVDGGGGRCAVRRAGGDPAQQRALRRRGRTRPAPTGANLRARAGALHPRGGR